MSAFRGSEIYINGKTKRRLRLILKATGEQVTVDEFADTLLNESILARWPFVADLEAEIAKIEESFRTKLEAWDDHGHLHT